MIDYFQNLPLTVQLCTTFLLALTLWFGLRFLLPGLLFRIRLSRLLTKLRVMKAANDTDLSSIFESDNTLSHLWQEFKETLHKQKEVNVRTGVYETIAMRSTVPAEVFFSTQALVDSRLSTEFFKHLPGIFTGIGIIGTFFGLLQGLRAFHVSENPQIARDSLNALLHGVSEAFIVSASAITLAMVVTFIEKLLVAGLYRKVEELAYLLDSMFEAGAGEEYLARLVKASEDSASQTKILKDALVADLKQVLAELTQQQIQANVAGHQQLGQQIVEGLQAGLRDPLDRIATAVQQVGQDQGSAVNQLLTDVLAGFSQRLQDLFGGQITGINQLQQQTVQALQTAAAKLEEMASNIETAGQRGTDAMTAKLTDALSAMEARQNLMNERMADFVDQIRNLVRDTQSETNQKLQTTLAELGEKTAAMIGALTGQAEQAAAGHSDREHRVAQHTEETVTKLGGQIDAVVAEVARASSDMRASVEVMRGVTTEAVSKMNNGADTLYIAASEFAKAGQGVTTALNQASHIADKLSHAASVMTTSTHTLESVVVDYKASRETTALMISELRSLVESAKREAALTADVLERIESATQKLVQAQQEADHYLEGVSQVLGESHQAFADSMRKTLGEANQEFYNQLTSATSLLREGIEELEATLDINDRKN